MDHFAVVIIGAGAAGLLAARDLSRAGLSILLLEAAPSPGGRIQTIQGRGFSAPIEAGAEFVHGSLPITLSLLEAAGISKTPVKGHMVEVHRGQWGNQSMFAGHWDELMEKMSKLERDIPIAAFLATEFHGEKYTALRESVQRFAEGYDLADISTASTRALYAEWQEEGQEEYRIDGGYGRLIDSLAAECIKQGCQILTNSPAKEIRWRPGRVEVLSANDLRFSGDKILLTVSLGILKAESPPTDSISQARSATAHSSPAQLEFFPPIPDYRRAAGLMGYGAVIKILMEFKDKFWEDKAKDISFILSDEPIPTWWLQSHKESHLLTGWLTGAALQKFQGLDETAKRETCIRSIASLFAKDPAYLAEQLTAMHIADWPAAPYIQGGYSFETTKGAEARRLLSTPLLDTLFFAGEALYEGPSPATVEAAFTSGQMAAKRIIEGAKKR